MDINENCIGKLEEGDFSNFPVLRYLSIRFQDMSKCRHQYKTLSLERGAISNLPLLMELHLNGNGLSSKSMALLENIGTKSSQLLIVLNYNYFPELVEDFLVLPSVTSLEMNYCTISWIHPNAFRQLRNIRILRMGQNRLSSLPSGLFQFIKNLHFLDLSWNKFTTFSGEAFRSNQTVLKL
jgi:Leucine-rich repeat (LRR) protein